MTRKQPLRLAAWLLDRLAPDPCNESLAGDLLEEFASGRSVGWYWRQVIVAIFLGWYREVIAHSTAILFALVWCMLAPSWGVVTDKALMNSRAIGLLWRIDWPWSAIGAAVLSTLVSLSFAWIGICVYLGMQLGIEKTIPIGRIPKGLILTFISFFATSAAVFVIVLALPEGRTIDRGTLTPFNVIADTRMWALENRIVALTSLLSALWIMSPGAKKILPIRPSGRPRTII